jgi:rhamnosyl/mannosyltransferase
MVEDGVTGYVVAPRAPDELAAALRKLLTDSRNSRAMGAAGRRRVEERFSAAATARRVCEVYDEASGRRS